MLTGSTGSPRRLGHTLRLGDDLDNAGVVAALANNPAAVAGCCAVGVLMLLDHYAWTMALGRVIAWAPLAVVAAVGGRMAR